METRVSYVIVGSFVLALVVGLFLFVIWLTQFHTDRHFVYYFVRFSGSVTGLQEGSPVRYRGILEGSVLRVRIDPQDSDKVEVLIKVDSETPINTETVASLELQGITGAVYIQLTNLSKNAPPLRPQAGETYAVIRSHKSELQRLFSDAPQVIGRVDVLVGRANLLLSDHNLQAISATLDNIRMLTGALADRSGEIQTAIDQSATAARDMSAAAASFRTLAANLETDEHRLAHEADQTLTAAHGFVSNTDNRVADLTRQARPTLVELNKMAVQLNKVADQIDAMVKENRPGLRSFSSEGLYEFTQFLSEARQMVQSITRLTNRFEADPARFLFGNQQQGVPVR